MTLSSDLGAAYAAQMKAVLVARVPPERIVDLAHDLRPHDIAEAAFVVRAMAARFPAGSIHVVVVDPGVGGRRAPVVVACRDGSALVGPDNGVLAPLCDALGGGTVYRLDPARAGVGPRIGTTFDGRDLFAPAAARLATGTAPNRLGPTRGPLHRRSTPPRRRVGGADGTIAHVDRFGNLITDLPSEWVPRTLRALRIRAGRSDRTVPWVTSYEAAGRGSLAVLGSSFGTLELSVAWGSAARRLGLRTGDRLSVGWSSSRPRRPRRKG